MTLWCLFGMCSLSFGLLGLLLATSRRERRVSALSIALGLTSVAVAPFAE